jgi:hypothetical protein
MGGKEFRKVDAGNTQKILLLLQHAEEKLGIF